MTANSLRLAAYGVCLRDSQILLARWVSRDWTDLAEWVRWDDVDLRERSTLVDIGRNLARAKPRTGHVLPIAVEGPVLRH